MSAAFSPTEHPTDYVELMLNIVLQRLEVDFGVNVAPALTLPFDELRSWVNAADDALFANQTVVPPDCLITSSVGHVQKLCIAE